MLLGRYRALHRSCRCCFMRLPYIWFVTTHEPRDLLSSASKLDQRMIPHASHTNRLHLLSQGMQAMQQFQKQDTDKYCCTKYIYCQKLLICCKSYIRVHVVLLVYTYTPCCNIVHRLLSCDINGSPSHSFLISPTVGVTFHTQVILAVSFPLYVLWTPGYHFCLEEDEKKSPELCGEGTKVT